MIRHIDFDAARVILEKASAIHIDGLFYVLRPMEKPDVIELSMVTDGKPMRVAFHRADQKRIPLRGNSMLLQERYGEDAELKLSQPWELVSPAVTVFKTAETAAAIMDAIHSAVTRQHDGSVSAYAELYEVATESADGFPSIWCWVATLAEAARDKMEPMWDAGEAEFIDCVHVVAQLFHNFITDPASHRSGEERLTKERAVSLWDEALVALRKREDVEGLQGLMQELTMATRSGAGYPVGCFRRVSEVAIEYTNYGGPPMMIRRLDNGLWRVNDDRGTDSPRPVGAFKIASIPIVRE